MVFYPDVNIQQNIVTSGIRLIPAILKKALRGKTPQPNNEKFMRTGNLPASQADLLQRTHKTLVCTITLLILLLQLSILFLIKVLDLCLYNFVNLAKTA